MTFRTALAFASVSLFSVACDDNQTANGMRGDQESSTARMSEPGDFDDLPVFDGGNWGGNDEDEIVQELLLDGEEVDEVGFLAQMNPFGDPVLYVYDAAAFPNAGCAKGIGSRSVPEFAPGEASANDPVEVPMLRVRYQSKTGDWIGESLTWVDNGTTVTFEDQVSGLIQIHEQEVPQAVGETLVLDLTFMALPIFSGPSAPEFADGLTTPLHRSILGAELSHADAQDWRLEEPPGSTWAELSVDLDVACASGR